jgi:GLPGLI family protein
MKSFLTLVTFFMASASTSIPQNQKILSDCIVVYDVSVDDAKSDPQIVNSMAGSTKILYIKGSKTRSELISPNFQQAIIHDGKTDSTVILREFGNNKYMSFLNAEKRNEKIKKFEGITFTNTDETKTILGYECKKVVAKLKDGSVYNVYYATSIVPSNKDYEYQFKDLPGFVLEYEAESENGKSRVKYTASKITLSPVASAKFDIPKSGYRIL